MERIADRCIVRWLIDTEYPMEGFFVRHAYFLGANDPCSALKTTLKGETGDKRNLPFYLLILFSHKNRCQPSDSAVSLITRFRSMSRRRI